VSGFDLLFVPGWNGSGPNHWQTIWERDYGGLRVEQRDWAQPDTQTWVDTLDASIRRYERPIILVSHSLGVLTTARWTATSSLLIAGAFLVAPPDPEVAECDEIRQFTIPNQPLSFPALLVASENDPYASLDSAQKMACAWRCDFWNAGRAGHINVASGHGPWREGQARFADFLAQLARSGTAAA
jgi:predicted alpha/beta hydrolase family esterase